MRKSLVALLTLLLLVAAPPSQLTPWLSAQNAGLNRTTAVLMTNKSGGAVSYGDVVVVDTTTDSSFTTTTTSGISTKQLGVVLDVAGIANNASGMIAIGGWVPRINLNTAATRGQFIKSHTVAGQGTPHSSPQTEGDFATALEASANPKAILFGSPNAAVVGATGVTTTGSPASGDIAKFSGSTTITNAAVTGSGSVVLATSPTLVTPALGTPSAVTLTNATGFPYATGGTGIVPAANGGAGTVNGILKANGSGTVSAATSSTDYAPATSGSLPLFGNGSGGFTNGTVQGNTTKVVTYAGSAPATSDCAKFDANGNVTTAGAACGSGSGTGQTFNLGSLVLLAEKTASSSASLDFTTRTVLGQSGAVFQSDFDEYVVEIVSLAPATNATTLQMKVSTDGGATWVAGSSYVYNNWGVDSGGGSGITRSTSAALFVLGDASVLSNAAGATTNATLTLQNAATATNRFTYQGMMFRIDSGPTYRTNTIGGTWNSASAVNAIQFTSSSGNLASGTIRLYGIANSATTTTAAGGSLILRETQTASSSATLDFTSCLSSAWDTYYFEIVGMVPAAGTPNLVTQFSTDGGATFLTTNYADSLIYHSNIGGSGVQSGDTAYIRLNENYAHTTAANGGVTGWMHLSNTTSTTQSKFISFHSSNINGADSNLYTSDGGGWNSGTAAVNAVRFKFRETGGTDRNTASGTIRCYAVSNTVPQLGPMNYMVANGRLTTETGVPVSTSDRTSQTTLYFTPYQGNQIGLYTAGVWGVIPFSETTLALGTLTSGKNYDVFGYSNAGTLTLEFSAAWSSDTTRTDAISLQDGIYVKTSDKSRRFLGTIRTTSTTTTEDSLAKRFVWNAYNQQRRAMRVLESTDSWNYATATYRQANANTANQLDYVTGDASSLVEVNLRVNAYNPGGVAQDVQLGVGVDSTTVNSAQIYGGSIFTTIGIPQTASYVGSPGLGRHFLAWLEKGAGSGTDTWFGDNAGAYSQGITGFIQN